MIPPLRTLVQAQLARGEVLQLTVVGWSMAPLLHPGDRVEARAVAPAEVQCGDLLVVWQHTSFLTHRVLRSAGNHVLLKGDASLAPDPLLPIEALVGLVVGRWRGNQHLALDTTRWRALHSVLGWLNDWGLRVAPRSCCLATRLILALMLALALDNKS